MTAVAKLGNEGFIYKMEPVDFAQLVAQTAANILVQVPQMSLGNEMYGAAKILPGYVTWAPHGYVNALQTEVEFLYEALPFMTGDTGYLFGKGERLLVRDALRAYQEYKTKVVQEQQRVNGKDFGSGTEFNKKDWTDRNHLLDV